MSSAAAVSVVYAVDAVIALTAAIVIWPRRASAGAAALSGMLFAASWWALADAIELHVSTVAAKQLVSQLQYIGIVAAAPAYFEAALRLAGDGGRLTRRWRTAVWGVPIASLAIAWTNDLHHWLWTRIDLPGSGSPFATYHYGWWFWVLTTQNYVLMAGASARLLRSMRAVSRGFRTAMALVIVATILPWLGNVAYNLKLGPWPGLNWLTLSLGVSGWILVWVVLQGGLLDLLPRAYTTLIEMMTDAVVVLDRGGSIICSNAAARERLQAPILLGIVGVPSLSMVPPEWNGQREVSLRSGRRWLDVTIGPVFDRWGSLAGRIVVARDVTLQKQLELDREALIATLQDALHRVTQLEGLLPVCAGCHSVRDDQGGWTSIERYIASRTPVEFTHGICPDCMTRLYPELTDTPAPAPLTA